MIIATVVESTRAALQDNPAAGAVTFRADNALVGTTEVDVQVRGHRFKVDEPESLGGSDVAANPVELVLAALGACQAITFRVWGAHLGIPFDTVHVRVEGDLDVRGFFGVDDEVRAGFSGVHVTATISGPESPERYAELHKVVEEHCPVQDILANPVPVTGELVVA